MAQRLDDSYRFRRFKQPGVAILIIAGIGIVGSLLLFVSHAATPTAVVESENGMITAPAAKVSDSTAAGGSSVKFGAATVQSGGNNCPAYPAFPDATCTGVPAGTPLTPSGALDITQAGAVIQNLDIAGTVTIDAANVTIKDCKIHGGDYYGVYVNNGSVTVSDSEIYGFSEAAIGFDNWKGYNLNIHGVGSDGVKFGSNSLLQDSYLHDFTTLSGAHADGGQMQAGETKISIVHNYINITGPAPNSALFMAPDQGPSANGPVLIDRNLLGSGNYTLYIVDGNNGTYHESGYTVTNNHFLSNAQYGATDINEPPTNFTLWSGNVYDATGATIGL